MEGLRFPRFDCAPPRWRRCGGRHWSGYSWCRPTRRPFRFSVSVLCFLLLLPARSVRGYIYVCTSIFLSRKACCQVCPLDQMKQLELRQVILLIWGLGGQGLISTRRGKRRSGCCEDVAVSTLFYYREARQLFTERV